MSTTSMEIKLAVSTMTRYPYYRARVLGPRAQSEPGELVVPLRLNIDNALLKRSTVSVRIDIPTPETPHVTVLGS